MVRRKLPHSQRVDSSTDTVFYLLKNIDKWREIAYGLQGDYIARKYIDERGIICFEDIKHGKRIALVKLLDWKKPNFIKYEVHLEGFEHEFVTHIYLTELDDRSTKLTMEIETDFHPLVQLFRERKLRELPRLKYFYEDIITSLKKAARYKTAIEKAKATDEHLEKERERMKEEYKKLKNMAFFVEHAAKLEELAHRYDSFYDSNPYRLWAWLNQFPDDERKIGLKLAENVKYYSPPAITRKIKELKERLQIFDKLPENKNIFFIPLGEIGKSASIIAYDIGKLFGIKMIKRINDINDNGYVTVNKNNIKVDQLIFFDDFIGSGKQAIKYWKTVRERIIRWDIPCIYVAIVGFKEGREKVVKDTNLEVILGEELDEKDKIFSDKCTLFDSTEKEVIKKMCELASSNKPLGYGGLGATVVFWYNTPNNTITILRARPSEGKYFGLFPRRMSFFEKE